MSYERPSPTEINLSELVDKIYNELHYPHSMGEQGHNQQEHFFKNSTGIHINENYFLPIPSPDTHGDIGDLYDGVVSYFNPYAGPGAARRRRDPPTKVEIKTQICHALGVDCESGTPSGGMKKRVKSRRKKPSKRKSHRKKKLKKRKGKTKRRRY
mgnify:FL=1|tara:strand:- start:46 stop:510 length:465 start_codon:yes stop_codon:yes gene_type:complete